MRNEIVKLLEDKESLLGDCFMIKTPLRKQKRTHKTLIFFLMLMVISFYLVYCVVFPRVDVWGAKITVLSAFGSSVLFCVIAWLKDPGYIKKDP